MSNDYPEFFVTSCPKARKDHKCCECRCGIKKGETYHYCAGKWDGDFRQFKACNACANLRGELAASVVDNDDMPGYGELRDDEWAGPQIREREKALADQSIRGGQ